MSTTTLPKPYGMVPLHAAKRTRTVTSPTPWEAFSVLTGNGQTDAPQLPMTPGTNAQAVASKLTELRSALKRRRLYASSPYNPEAWHRLLHAAGLQDKYPTIPHCLQFGFDAGIPPISHTFALPNHPTIDEYSAEFDELVQIELQKGRYIGPVSREEVDSLLGAFQISPFSIIENTGWPGKYRLIQNLSFPNSPVDLTTSINCSINSDQYPCTWGTFATICLLISRLPPGSQAVVRNVKEAYRTIPIRPDQWPGLVVRLHGDDKFTIDTHDCFGLASGGGIYGLVGDASTQIMHFHDIAPLSKWVDNHVFF